MAHWYDLFGLGRLFGDDNEPPLDQTFTSQYVAQNAAIRRADPAFPEVGYAPGNAPVSPPAQYAVSAEGARDPWRHDVVIRNASQHHHR